MATYGKRDRTKAERLKRLSAASTSAGSSSLNPELVATETQQSVQNGAKSHEDAMVPFRASPRVTESPEMESAQSEPPQGNSMIMQLENGDQVNQDQDASSDISSAPSSSSSLETGRLLLEGSLQSSMGLSRVSPAAIRQQLTANAAMPLPNMSAAWPATQPFPLPAASSSRSERPPLVQPSFTASRSSSSSLSPPEPTDSDHALPSRQSTAQPNGTTVAESSKRPGDKVQQRARVSDVYGRARTRQNAPQNNKGKAPAASQDAAPESCKETRRSHWAGLEKETNNEVGSGSPSSSSVPSRSQSQSAASTSPTSVDHNPSRAAEEHAPKERPPSSPSRQQPSRFLAKRPPRHKRSSQDKGARASADLFASAPISAKPAPLKRKRSPTPEPMPSPAVAEAKSQSVNGVEGSDELSSSSPPHQAQSATKRAKVKSTSGTEAISSVPAAPEEPRQTRARASESKSKQTNATATKKAEAPAAAMKKAQPKSPPQKKPRISLGSSSAQRPNGTQEAEQQAPAQQAQKGKAKGKQMDADEEPAASPAKSSKKQDAKQAGGTKPAAPPKRSALKNPKSKAAQPDKAAEQPAEEAESPDMPSTRRQTRSGGQRGGVRFAPVESEDEYSADDLDELPLIDDDEAMHPPAEDVRLYTAASDDAIALIIPGIWHSRQCPPSFAERFPDKSLRQVKAVRQAVMMWRKLWIKHKLRVTVFTCDKSLITELEHKIRDKRVAEAVIALREEYLDRLNATEGVEVSVDYLTEEKNADAIRLAEVDPLEALAAAAEAGSAAEDGFIE